MRLRLFSATIFYYLSFSMYIVFHKVKITGLKKIKWQHQHFSISRPLSTLSSSIYLPSLMKTLMQSIFQISIVGLPAMSDALMPLTQPWEGILEIFHPVVSLIHFPSLDIFTCSILRNESFPCHSYQRPLIFGKEDFWKKFSRPFGNGSLQHFEKFL